MNNTEQEIENMLRRAPKPVPNPGLKEKLLKQAVVASRQAPALPRVANVRSGWFRRWWPALASATASVACAVVLTVQRMEIADLKDNLKALAPAAVGEAPQPQVAATATSDVRTSEPAGKATELDRLRQLATQLTSDVTRLEQMRIENERLRAQIAARSTAAFSSEEMDAMNKARERAFSIACVNNLKQIGLAVRVWSLDNGDVYPTNFLCMSNELNTPKILICPADTNRVVAANFSTFTDANSSYEFFSGSDKEPTQVLTRCPIHGSIGLTDGSVQMGVAKKHPEWLVERDGKLYFERQAEPPVSNSPPSSSP